VADLLKRLGVPIKEANLIFINNKRGELSPILTDGYQMGLSASRVAGSVGGGAPTDGFRLCLAKELAQNAPSPTLSPDAMETAPKCG